MSTNLGDLLKNAGLSASPESASPAADAAAAPEDALAFAPKVVVRATRKGRGGKTVTEVQGVLGGRDDFAKSLRKALGVGTSVEGDLVIVQGDQCARLVPLLEKRGASRVVRG